MSSDHTDRHTRQDHRNEHALRTPRIAVYELRPPEKLNLAGHDTGRDHLSHTAIGTFLACQQKFGFHYDQRLDPAITKPSLQVGRAFAHALEQNDPEAGARFVRLEASVEAARAAASPWILAPSRNDIEINATIAREAARAYLNRYGARGQTREVELRARIRNPARGGRYSLTHDLLARVDALDLDGALIVEDKLQSQIPRASLSQRLRLDRQVTIGCYLTWRCYGVEVREVSYRITKKPQIRQRQNETFEGYLDRIASDYATKPDEYLHEEPVTRSPEDFLRFEHEVWTWAESIRQARRSAVWPRNVASCADYGGCSYLPLCSREPGAQHQFVERKKENQMEAAA